MLEPGPQTFVAGSPVAARPAMTASRSSVKAMSVATELFWSRFSIVNCSVTVSPGRAVPSNAFVSVTGPITGMVSVAVAGSPTNGRPSSSGVNDDVVFTWLPDVASSGTVTVTDNMHDAPAATEPPVKVSRDVPESWEPGPQMFVAGSPVATRAGITASRSSVNAMSAATELLG